MRLPAGWASALAPLSALTVLLAMIAGEGGFATGTWALAGLFMLALLALVLTLAPSAPDERSPLVTAGLAAYAAYVAWTFLSMLWADAPALAWEAADRALVYGLVLALVCLRPWRRPAAECALALVAVGTALAALIVLLRTATVAEPGRMFLTGRLAEPLEYANATANLYLIGLWPALHFAVSPRVPWPLRGLALAAAGVLAQTALLSQSRGGLIGFGLAALVVIALAPRRLPALLALGGVVGATAVGFGTLTDVRNAATLPQLEAALSDARSWIAVTALVLGVAGALAAFSGRFAPESLHGRRGRRMGDAAVAVLAVAGVVAFVAAIGNPVRWADDRWEDFKTAGYEQVESGDTRFTGSLGSNRYDFWRVAWGAFKDQPVLGLGADNFGAAYLLERASSEAPRYAHSLPFSTLGELGIVGALLLAGALGVLLAAALARRRALGSTPGAEVVATALAGSAAFAGHSLVDWLWQFPTLAGIALLLLGVAARTVPDEVPEVAAETRPVSRPVRSVLIGAGAVVATLALAGPGAAARFIDTANRSRPETAFGWLERAASANALSAEPLLREGVIARRTGDLPRATAALREAIEREPANWFGHFELALVRAQAGDRAGALSATRRASALNPGQPLVAELQQQLQRGRRVDAGSFESRLSGQLGAKLTPFGAATSPKVSE